MCIVWMLQPILGTRDTLYNDSYWTTIMWTALSHNGHYIHDFDFTPANSPTMGLGSKTWDWPVLPLCKSKPIGASKCDALEQFLYHGTHMPIITWIGGNRHDMRSQEASIIRKMKREAKGIKCHRTRCRGGHGHSNDTISFESSGSNQWSGGHGTDGWNMADYTDGTWSRGNSGQGSSNSIWSGMFMDWYQ